MKWQQIREHHPEQWLLIEAVKAHTEDDQRILEEISVIDEYTCSQDAMQAYRNLHLEDPEREMFVVHTSRSELDIKIRRWVGLRGVR